MHHFDNFTQLPSYLPGWAWSALRQLSLLSALAMAMLLVAQPALGLQVFWGLVVPLLPMLFMFVPGLWRNLCPLASSNQAPRRLGLQRTTRTLSPAAAYPIGVVMCVAFIVSRKLLFQDSGPATAALLLGAMASAFVGGLLFKGKSGWCSSICPLLPVQRLYGQTPFIKVANTQCEPCVGCMKNCYDFAPGAAYLADQYDPNPAYRNFRRLFAGIFPGLVLGFYLVPGMPEADAASVVAQMLVYMACSFTLFTMLDLLVGRTRNVLPVVFAVIAFNLYYWFAAPVFFSTLEGFGLALDATVLGALRASIAIGSLVWLGRSLNIERLFLRDQVKKSSQGEIRLAPIVVETVRLNRNVLARSRPRNEAAADGAVGPVTVVAPEAAAGAALAPAAAGAAAATLAPAATAATPLPASAPELCIAPAGKRVPLRKGQALLDALESCDADIRAGCRAGACGADPIAVIEGGELLGAVGHCERATLARLGHAPNTRLACMARLRTPGLVKIELKPHIAGTAGALVPASAADRAADSAAPAMPAAAPAAPTATPGAAAASVAPGVDRSVQRVVIVGNGVAGLTAAEHVRRLHPDCRIDLIGRENHRAYNRMAIAQLIHTRHGMSGLQLLPEQWYSEQRIHAWLATHVRTIDAERHEIELATGERLGWDRLILTTGSAARVPPMPGFGGHGSFVLRDADDALAIRRYSQVNGARTAVVLGAGLLGLEAAQALHELGLQVSLLAKGRQVLERQVDAAASDWICEHLESRGIAVQREAQVRAVANDGDGRCTSVDLGEGRSLRADMVVVCAGSQPNVELARAAGITLGRGLVVDETMRTSLPHVYAAGDVAEFQGETLGLWAVALQQGEIAAHNALGVARCYPGHIPVTALKVSGIDVRSAGVVPARPGDGGSEEHVHGSRERGRYVKVCVQGGFVVGGVMVGAFDEADQIIAAVQERRPWRELEAELASDCRFERGVELALPA